LARKLAFFKKENKTFISLAGFLGRFSKLDLAYGNYGVKEYARALMYLEDYLMDDPTQAKDHLSFLGVCTRK